MRQIYLLCLFLSGLFSCQRTTLPRGLEKLDEKAGPNDQFAVQRSWPDRDFDWKGWRKALGDIRSNQAVQERGAGGCSGNPVNWTIQGPANIGGRVNSLAVKPGDENTVLAGFSGGGIFKTTDGGLNWHPVFDDHIELSIGHIVFDPVDPNTVYAGTGDPNIPSIVFNGDGIFKSTDAGETWQYLGLAQQGIISKIRIDPSNPQVLYAATMGNPFVRDNERGIYKSTDGGQHWTQVLFVSNQAGASDLVINPANPQVLYASFWDRLRNNQESVVYGPHARVYKTTDGGQHWTQLGGGLPAGVMGRTGLAISATNPDKVYAVYIDSLSTPGGLFKTVDAGATWTPVNIDALEDKCADFGWYFGKITLNPANDEEIYFHAIIMWRKAANSNAWLTASGGHADSHDLVITPSGRRYWANDGGVYRNDPGSNIWTRCKNLPTTQFYHTSYNPHTPNIYWGGAQDNGIKKGNAADINNWLNVYPADGFRTVFHPTDPNTYWAEIQYASINKTTNGGQTWQVGQECLGTTDRCNWDAPYFMSVHNPEKQFSATYRAYISSDGVAWAPISGDLTDGNIYGARFHTVSCLNESALLADKFMAGTSDGNVWRREPTGGWVNITAGLPDRYVTSVHVSPTLSQRLFVTHSGFRNSEYIPHVHRSDNNGQTWIDISGDLPQMPVNDLFVLPGHADSVLFVATDAGVYFSRNGGLKWGRLGANMPFIPVFDLEHNPVRKEVVAATYARGIWTFPLDSVFVQQNAVTVSVAGVVKTETGAGTPGVSVNGQITGSGGAFYIAGVPGCQDYTATPVRNDNPLNGVSTFDLVLISKHILNLEPLASPYKMLAADANRSGSITTFDVVTIRKVILGIDTNFFNNKSWRFVPADFVFPNPANPFQTPVPEERLVSLQTTPVADLNFTAIKVGDVNNTVNPVKESSAEERIRGQWPIVVQDRPFRAGETVSVEWAAVVEEIAGVQFSVHFDPEKLQFERIEPLLPGLSREHFGMNRSAGGQVSVCFEPGSTPFAASVQEAFIPPQTLNIAAANGVPPAPLFRLAFRAKTDGHLRESLTLCESPTPALAFRPDGTALKPVLEFDAAGAGSAAIQVRPNPFGAAGVWIHVPPSSKNIRIFDEKGGLIVEKPTAGAAMVFFAAGIFPETGPYFYKVEGKETLTGKMIYQR